KVYALDTVPPVMAMRYAEMLGEEGADLGIPGWSDAARAAAHLSRLRKHPIQQTGRDTGYADYLAKAAKGLSTKEAQRRLLTGEIADTLTWHQGGQGRPTPLSAHRKSEHRRIIKRYLAHARDQENPEALFTAGGGASGKSALL